MRYATITVKPTTWTYDASASEFQFSPDLDVAKAVYNAGRQTLVFTLRTGAHRDHVAGSDFACWPKTWSP